MASWPKNTDAINFKPHHQVKFYQYPQTNANNSVIHQLLIIPVNNLIGWNMVTNDDELELQKVEFSTTVRASHMN